MSNPDLYRTYVTQTGFGLEAAAKAAGAGVFDGSVWFVIGDEALDEATNPQTMTDLLNQVRSYPATIEQDNDDPTIWIARVEIPADDGGFFIREAGIRVDDRDAGDLYCYARQAGDYKPELTEGQGKSYTIRLQFIPGNADVINAKIDPSVQFATPTDLNNAINAHVKEEDPHEQYLKEDEFNEFKQLSNPLTQYLLKDAKATLTNNDGVGNANLVFNHIYGVPNQDGSAGRLNVGTDINDAAAWFGLASNVKAGVAVELTKIFTATLTDFDVKVGLKENGQRVFSPNNRNISDAITATSSTVYASQKAVKSVNDKFTNLFVGTKGANGYQKLPNGLIIQWGFGQTDVTGKAKANFPVAFPNACLSVVATHKGSGPCNVISNEITKTYVTFFLNNLPDLVGNSGWWAYYVAIGY